MLKDYSWQNLGDLAGLGGTGGQVQGVHVQGNHPTHLTIALVQFSNFFLQATHYERMVTLYGEGTKVVLDSLTLLGQCLVAPAHMRYSVHELFCEQEGSITKTNILVSFRCDIRGEADQGIPGP